MTNQEERIQHAREWLLEQARKHGRRQFWTNRNVAAYAQSREAKWIRVRERLPELEDHMGVEETTVVLVRHGKGTPQTAYMSKDGKWTSYWGAGPIPKPTHWMPLLNLPDPPEE